MINLTKMINLKKIVNLKKDGLNLKKMVRRFPLLSSLDVSHCPLLTSGGLLRLVVKAPLTDISVAGEQRDVAPILKLHLLVITVQTLQAARWLQV